MMPMSYLPYGPYHQKHSLYLYFNFSNIRCFNVHLFTEKLFYLFIFRRPRLCGKMEKVMLQRAVKWLVPFFKGKNEKNNLQSCSISMKASPHLWKGSKLWPTPWSPLPPLLCFMTIPLEIWITMKFLRKRRKDLQKTDFCGRSWSRFSLHIIVRCKITFFTDLL